MTSLDWSFILRLLLAGFLGGLIGLEREMRAKGAGIRTHFIVALGSALFMIISMFAFEGTDKFDSSRVAAGVVSGIGFIGGGVIIFQRNAIRGITTAAGMWVASAIGLACGAGPRMYPLAAAATIITLLVLELLHFFHLRYGEKLVEMTLSSQDKDLLSSLDVLKAQGVSVESYSLNDGKIQISLRLKLKDYLDQVRKLSAALEGFRVDALN